MFSNITCLEKNALWVIDRIGADTAKILPLTPREFRVIGIAVPLLVTLGTYFSLILKVIENPWKRIPNGFRICPYQLCDAICLFYSPLFLHFNILPIRQSKALLGEFIEFEKALVALSSPSDFKIVGNRLITDINKSIVIMPLDIASSTFVTMLAMGIQIGISCYMHGRLTIRDTVLSIMCVALLVLSVNILESANLVDVGPELRRGWEGC